LGYDATIALNACADYFISPTNFYSAPGDGPGPNIGETLYTDSALTTPAPDGYYSNGVAWYQVTGGAGLITSADPNGCAISPTPTPTNTETPTPTNTSTPTTTPTPTPTESIFIISVTLQNGNDLLLQDGEPLLVQQPGVAFLVSSGDVACPSTPVSLTQTIYGLGTSWNDNIVKFYTDINLTTPFNGANLFYTNDSAGCGACYQIDSNGNTSNYGSPC
jgi:hypothetical protein